PPLKNSSVPRTVQFTPRLIVNTVRAAVASAAEGNGITRLFSYHIADQIRDGRLQILLDQDEPPSLPVHLLAPQGRLSVPKVRDFVDSAVSQFKRYFEHLSRDARDSASKGDANSIRSRRGRVSAE